LSYLADAPAAPSGTMPPRRLRLLGCEVDAIDMDEAVARIDAAIAERRFLRHADLNGAIVVAMRDDEKMRESIAGAGLVVADGQSVVWAARLLGQPLPARVPGIDLMHRTIELAERRGYSIYILGARQDVLETAVARLVETHPALRIAGCHDGYFEDSEELGVAEQIRRSGADILYVAIGSPRKEYFLARHGRSLGVPYVMGVGGAIDVVAGVTRRAPRWLQRLGLEWAFRLAQEPRRLFRRYLVTNARFLALAVREAVGRGRAGS
jgi:N-acetylglucosaminyldiphosphoundecaprenol N-acetyl-beta-D-mannosaminyltransferase